MQTIALHHPRKVAFGPGSLHQMADDYLKLNVSRLFILTDPHVADQVSPVLQALEAKNIKIQMCLAKGGEPSFADLREILEQARSFGADSIAGIGGGSVLDVAKLLAAMLHTEQPVDAFVGNGLIEKRALHLCCVPTTSGAGSEASPNAILIDDNDGAKKGIISPFLVPDSVYIDPTLMLTLPAGITAHTGLDALTHCIEAYANKFAHPMVDMLALEGIRLISGSLGKAIDNGKDMEARSRVALGSYYGGMCLGPVNTAAVHALAYPLGTQFKIPHGLSNALLLPYVLEFNLCRAEGRYAGIARVMGAREGKTDHDTALNGFALIRDLIQRCGMPSRLSDLDIPLEALDELAQSAMKIQRLLKNNVREISEEDAASISQQAY